MAISTQGTVLKIKNGEEALVTVNIKSFPDLGAAPAAILLWPTRYRSLFRE